MLPDLLDHSIKKKGIVLPRKKRGGEGEESVKKGEVPTIVSGRRRRPRHPFQKGRELLTGESVQFGPPKGRLGSTAERLHKLLDPVSLWSYGVAIKSLW